MGNKGAWDESGRSSPNRYPIMTQEDVIRNLLDDRQRLCSVAYAVVTDFSRAEDLFQDLVIKAVHRIAGFIDADHLAKWSTVTIRNSAIDHVRQTRTRMEILSNLAYERIEARRQEIASRLADNDRRDALHLCLDCLSESERELLQRRYERGESGEELAQAFNLSVDAIYKRLSRLHKHLKTAVEAELSNSSSTPDFS